MKILLLVLVALFTGNAAYAAVSGEACMRAAGGDSCDVTAEQYETTVSNGKKIDCRCRYGINGNLTMCIPSNAACYAVDRYPYLMCNTGYVPNADNTACIVSVCDDCNTTYGSWMDSSTDGYERRMATKMCAPGCVCTNCSGTSWQYRCASGYYGTASVLGTSGCTACPVNATCAGGNGSTFVCNTGYTKSGDQCVASTCGPGFFKMGARCMLCSDGTYKVGTNTATSCTNCPSINLLPTGGIETISGGVGSNLPRSAKSNCYMRGEFRNAAGEFQIDSTNCTYQDDSSSGFGL